MKGKFYGIGVGPGDPELMTLKAVRIIKEVDILCVPVAKTEKESFAFTIVQEFVPEGKEILEVLMPMTKDKEKLEAHWREGARLIQEKINQGKSVAFITLGDSMIYSTYSYLLRNLKELDSEIEITTIPGISSFSASAARTNIPLAEGEEPLVILPVQKEDDKLQDVLTNYPNAVLMKVAAKFPRIVKTLEETGKKDKAIYISRCSGPEEFIETDLDKIKDQKLDYFSLMLVKKEGLS